MSKTVILAYSGGLDTSALIPWLREKYDHKVDTEFVGPELRRLDDLPGSSWLGAPCA